MPDSPHDLPPDLPINYKAIYLERDRSWSLRIIDRLRAGVKKKELKKILSFVDDCDDFRMEAPVTQILEDASLSDKVRDHASKVLCHLSSTETPAQRQLWWSSQDPILMRHAIRVAERSVPEEAALIEKLASDPADRFHGDAIKALAFGFPEPRFQALKIAALSHPDSSVRKKAAKALYWDQPVSAESALLTAATDTCDDVAFAALDALCWYTSKNALLQLHELRCHGRQDLFCNYNNTFKWVLSDCLDVFWFERNREVESVAHYRSWLEPLWNILSFYRQPDENSDNDSSLSAPELSKAVVEEVAVKPSVEELIAEYSNPDKPRWTWEEGPCDWKLYSESEQSELVKFFLASPDYLVRRLSARAFAVWNAADALLSLIADPVHIVRRFACYVAKDHSPNQRIREALYKTFYETDISDSFAIEVLESYIVHAQGPELDQWLLHSLMTDCRETIRQTFTWTLAARNPEMFAEALPLLYEEPMLTWSLHAALLSNCVDSALPPLNLAPLMAIDDFNVQEYLSSLVAEYSRQ